MPSFRKPTFGNPARRAVSAAGSLAPLVLLAVVSAGGSAVAEERCTGTLCDLYYAARPAEQPAPAAPQSTGPTPVTVPTTGGILNFFKGGSSDAPTTATAAAAPGAAAPSKPFMYLTEGTHYDRCTGTLCDAYYGATASSSDKPAAQPQQTASRAPAGAAPAPQRSAPTAEQIALAKAAQQRRAAQEAREQANAKCRLAAAGDPWHCFR